MLVPLIVAGCTGAPVATTPVCSQVEHEGMRIDRIDEDIYVVAALTGRNSVPSKTITFILTDEGVVAIDTGSEESAARAKEYLRTITDLPITWIVYSHHHGTQTQGAHVLRDEGTRFVAHEDFPLEVQWLSDTKVFNRRLNSIQFNLNIPKDAEFVIPPLPDVTYGKSHALEVGGKRIELHHVEGEARDYTIVWLPDRKVLWVADLVNDSFPMVASPMKPVRDPLRWKAGIDFMRTLEPAVMVNAVDPPYCDPVAIDDLLEVQSRLLGFLHEAVVAQIEAGATEMEAVRAIELPAEFADLPQSYGSLEFAVRGIHQLYTGFWDQNATTLKLTDPRATARAFIDSMGGNDAVFAKAEELAAARRAGLALAYCDLLIDADREVRALSLKADLLARQADQPSENRVLVNMLRYLSNWNSWAADRPDKAFEGEEGIPAVDKAWTGGRSWRKGKAAKAAKAGKTPEPPADDAEAP